MLSQQLRDAVIGDFTTQMDVMLGFQQILCLSLLDGFESGLDELHPQAVDLVVTDADCIEHGGDACTGDLRIVREQRGSR